MTRKQMALQPKYIVKIEHDQDCSSPMENDGNWQFYSFCDRHNNFKHPDEFFGEDGKPNRQIARKLRNGLAFLLSYHEHGLCRWDVSGHGPSCQWDSVSKAGIAVWEEPPGDMGAKTYEDRKKDCQGSTEEYTEWCNGNCYGYIIQERKLRNGVIKRKRLDSGWGFIGSDYVVEAACEALPEDATPENTKLESQWFQQYELNEHFKNSASLLGQN